MKKALLKDSFKQITKTFKRFLSIVLMALLGVGFFAGIKASAPDMQQTMDYYYDEHNVFDIQILSTLGFTDEDIEYLSQIEGIESVIGLHDKDALILDENSQYVARVIELSEENSSELIEGRFPNNNKECVVEQELLEDLKKQIGDTITLDDDIYINSELTIVGTVKSPLYISNQKGSSQLGSGVIEYYLYMPNDNIDLDAYTSLYINVNNAKELNAFSSKYEKTIEEVKNKIESISEEQAKKRYDSLIEEATQKVNDAQDELDAEKEKAQNEINDANKEIQDNENKLNNAQKELNSNRVKVNNEFSEAEQKIKEAEEQIANTEKLYEETKTNIDKITQQMQQDLEKLNSTTDENEIIELQTKIEQAKIQMEQLTAQNAIIGQQIEQGKQELEKNKDELEKNRVSAYKKLDDAQAEITNGKKEIENAKATLEDKTKEFEEEIAEAQKKLNDAREEINDIENPEWYIMDREEANNGFSSFKQDANSISNIGKIFPIVFFLVATLISLTSMTRMVDEQRTEIGLLQALGYNKFHICSKYLIYSALATIIGSLIGVTVCMNFLPKMVWLMYESMYNTLPEIIVEFNVYYATLGTVIAAACIVGSTLYAVLRKLKHTPAVLMIPKAPKPGKRVLLEKIPFIWKRLNFSHKVTVRNIFRYKKRFLMTIIGICGCTSLILAGFGLRDTISNLLPTQYGEIFKYNMIVSMKETLTDEEINSLIDNINNKEEVIGAIPISMKSATVSNNNQEKDVQIVTTNAENISDFITLRNSKTREGISLDKVIVTEKLAKLLEIEVGDSITIDNNTVQVGGITENYVGHYVYMNQEDIKYNVLLVKSNNLDEIQENELAKNLLDDYRVSSVNLMSTTINMMDNTISGLNYIVVILIGAAGLLAFVVLYNLSNVNISERIRELATIKVLGFYDKEVYQYVSRETIILTIIGILFGLVGGYFLNYFLIGATEADYIMYRMIVEPISYLYAIGITIIFTVIVNIFSYFALKKISMVESLKSVE